MRSTVSSNCSDWALRLPAASNASALSRSVPSANGKLRTIELPTMTKSSMTVSPSLTSTREPCWADIVMATLLGVLVTLSKSDEPVSSTSARSRVGLWGGNVSIVTRSAPDAALTLPARSSISTVTS